MIQVFKTAKPQNKGAAVESAAAKFLMENGLKIVTQNFNTKLGEIDIIARHKNVLVFVEVRYRKSGNFGSGAETVTKNKQLKVIKAAKIFLQKHYLNEEPECRFDVIDVSGLPWQFNWIENAFEDQQWI